MLVLVWVGLLAWTWGSTPAAAAERIVVEAQNYGLWKGEEQVFTAHGGVRVTQGQRTIEADMMRYDMAREEIVFEGNVVYRDPDNEMEGSSLRYLVRTQEAWLQDAEGILWSEEVGEPMFLFGREIYRNPDMLRLTQARLTTCAPGQPPYHFAAREVEIYPGDRMVLRSITFVEHGIPVLYWPYWVIPLRERASHLDFPQVGYSERDGWYVKNTYNYYLDSGDYGAAYMDYYQRRGVGGGARHVYQDDARGRGELYLYTVPNPEGDNDYEAEWVKTWRLRNGLEMDTRLGYEISVRPSEDDHEKWNGEWRLNHEYEGGSYRLTATYEKEEPDTLHRVNASADFVHQLGDWRLSWHGSFYRYLRDLGTFLRDSRRISYLGRAERRWGNYTLAVDIEQRVHPDIVKTKEDEKEPDPDWKSMHRLPEVSLSLNQRVLGLPFTLRGSVGHFKEYPGEIEGWRGAGSLILRGYSRPLTRTSSLNLRGSLTGYLYESDERQLDLDTRLTWTYRPWPSLRLTTEYHYRRAWGSTPFNFDKVTDEETITPQANWSRGPWNVYLHGRYDLLTESWSPLVSSIAYRRGNWDARLYTSYDLEQSTFREAVATVQLSEQDRFLVRMGIRYDFLNERWTRLDIDASMPLIWGWSLGTNLKYEPHNERFYQAYIKLTKDLGCREFSISYDHMDQEYWLEYRIYAFPLSRVRVGRSEDEPFLFESDILKELLDQ